MIIGLDHVQLAMPSGEEESARWFYRDVLKLNEVQKPETLVRRGGCWFEGPGTYVHLGVEDGFSPARKAHPAFLVKNLQDCQQQLQQAGIVFQEDDNLPDVPRIFTQDPFGNRIELIQDGCGYSQK